MEKRVAVISIVVRDRTVSHRINDILSDHGDVIRGRLGFPYPERDVSIIIILVDADQSTIGAISGAIGNLPGVTLLTMGTVSHDLVFGVKNAGDKLYRDHLTVSRGYEI